MAKRSEAYLADFVLTSSLTLTHEIRIRACQRRVRREEVLDLVVSKYERQLIDSGYKVMASLQSAKQAYQETSR